MSATVFILAYQGAPPPGICGRSPAASARFFSMNYGSARRRARSRGAPRLAAAARGALKLVRAGSPNAHANTAAGVHFLPWRGHSRPPSAALWVVAASGGAYGASAIGGGGLSLFGVLRRVASGLVRVSRRFLRLRGLGHEAAPPRPHAGNIGPGGAALWATAGAGLRESVHSSSGSANCRPRKLADFFAGADYGIATTPWSSDRQERERGRRCSMPGCPWW